jgi:hypothetical protein
VWWGGGGGGGNIAGGGNNGGGGGRHIGGGGNRQGGNLRAKTPSLGVGGQWAASGSISVGKAIATAANTCCLTTNHPTMVVLYIEGAQSRGGAVSPPPKKTQPTK